jgi:hypothetical protein
MYEGYDATFIRTTERKKGEITPRSVAEATHHGDHYEQNGERTAYRQATAEDRANARLIAAAPELLERLELLLNLAKFDCMDDKSNEWRNEMLYTRAAIAKARGEA